MKNNTNNFHHHHLDHHHHWAVSGEGSTFDSERAVLFGTCLFALGIFLSVYKYFRYNPGLFTILLIKIQKFIACPNNKRDTGKAREEHAINAIVSDPIPSGKFLNVYKQRRQGQQLSMEFKALARNQEDHTTNAALRNVLLNSKQEVVPYDHSRVIVWDRPEALGTDYYNASYIDGYNGPKEYISCQGPNTKCLVSFWHMVWQEGVSCIVMATGLFENAVQQCDKYWADQTRSHAHYGNIHIWHERSVYLAQLNIRTMRIQKEGSPESRLLTQYEMVGFHDESPDPGLLLDVRRRVQTLAATQPGPVLVHCRCGGGRTAVYVAVDFCLHQLQSEDRVDVYSTVLHLRRFRKNMVRTLSQYKQIYSSVAMFVQCGLTVYPADTLPAAYHVHYSHEGDSKHQRLEKEFQTLQSIVPRLSIGDCASGHRVENRSKSRDIMMLPPECARPYLATTDCGDSGTDFINAVYVNGYHSENSYLVTQWPMKKTMGDLWRMMHDLKIQSLVLMKEPQKFSRSYPRFWPKEVGHIVCYGPISVRYLNCERQAGIVTRSFAIRKPKRHPHLIYPVVKYNKEEGLTMNNLVGCELRQDELLIKMFQVLNAGQRSASSIHLDRNSRLSCDTHRHSHSSGGGSTKDGEKGGRQRRVIGIPSRSLLTLMELVADWQKQTNNRQPICTVSKDGSSRVGLYCAVAVCCDQFKVEKEVDVFNAVRLVRKNRPQLVPNIEEYHYIYHFMSEFIIWSGSKPDVVISEAPSSVLPHCDSDCVAATTVALPTFIHGGVYVVAKVRGSDDLALKAKGDHNSTLAVGELQTHCEMFPSECLSNNYPRHCHHDASKRIAGSVTSGSIVPCRLDSESGQNIFSKGQSATESHDCSGCGGSCPQTSNGDVPETSEIHSQHENNQIHLQHENKKSLNGKTGCGSSQLSYGQILSQSTLQPLGDIHRSPSDFSIIMHLPQHCTPDLSHVNIYPSPSSSQIPSPSPDPVRKALPPPAPFLTPERYQNGRILSGLSTAKTCSSLSPGSMCKSSSFFSCNSSLSISSNCLANGSLNQTENGDIHSINMTNGLLLPADRFNGHPSRSEAQHNKLGTGVNYSVYTGLSSSLPSSGLYHPDLSNVKACRTDNGPSHMTLIHASYASLDESASGSADGQDHSSLDWASRDRRILGRHCRANTDLHPSPTRAKVNSDQQADEAGREIIKDKSVDKTLTFSKIPASTFNLRQKIRVFRSKKKVHRMNPN